MREGLEKIEVYKRDISEGLRSAREILAMNRKMLEDRLKDFQAKQEGEAGSSDKEMANYQRSYRLNESLYNFISQKRAEAAISQASATSSIVIVNNPTSGPQIRPVPMQNYSYALVVGILLPLAIFLVMEFLNNKVQSKEDIEALCSVPVIGTIGHNPGAGNFAVADKPRSYLAESFRALRSNLNYFTEGKDRKVILITSSISGEGKTFTSINIATVLAFSGKRTLLVAGDMRKPGIAKEFGVSNKSGLSLLLSGQAQLEDVIVDTKIENLDFIAPGPTPPNPGELYLGNRTAEVMAEMVGMYEYVVFDSPPIGLVSDALALLSKVDLVLFVSRQNYTPMNAIAQLQFLVEQGQVQNVSIVLNDIFRVGMGYGYKYGYGYDYGYGYRYGQGRYYGTASKDYGYGDDAYQ